MLSLMYRIWCFVVGLTNPQLYKGGAKVGSANLWLNFCYFVSVTLRRPNWVTAWRKRLHQRQQVVATLRTYDNPDAVGYKGWIELPQYGVVAFVDLQDRLIYHW